MSSKSRLWTLAMALAASMGRPASAQQIRQLESEIREELSASPEVDGEWIHGKPKEPPVPTRDHAPAGTKA